MKLIQYQIIIMKYKFKNKILTVLGIDSSIINSHTALHCTTNSIKFD